MTRETLQLILERVHGLRILVVGDVMLDHYIWGDAYRISPEAPVPVVAVDRDSYVAGAATNVALNLRSLGAQAEVCGLSGRDEAGERLRDLLVNAGVDYDAERFACSGVPTIVKTRVVVRSQQLCRLDREERPSCYGLDQHAQYILDRAAEADAVILSDYAKGTLTAELIAWIVDGLRGSGKLVAMDPKPSRHLTYTGVGLLTPNRAEGLQMAGISAEEYEDFPAEEACRRIWDRHRPERLVITLGGAGMLLCEQGRVLQRIPTYAREVFDVSGAGDTAIAGLVTGLAAKASLEEAAHLANTAAGVVVGKVGTAVATPEEILAFEAHGGD